MNQLNRIWFDIPKKINKDSIKNGISLETYQKGILSDSQFTYFNFHRTTKMVNVHKYMSTFKATNSLNKKWATKMT